MCDFTKGIKLCSCGSQKIKFREQEHNHNVNDKLIKKSNKKNADIPLIYIWRLFRFVEEYTTVEMVGRYILPSDDIGNGLNAEWIALNLNLENCFDFDYTPAEGDNIFIQQNVNMGSYLCFIFTNGEWITEHHSPMTTQIEHIKDGLVRAIE
jgi:hypothetical protein